MRVNPTRVFMATLLRVGALHQLFNAVGVIQFLHQSERLDADFAIGEVFASQVEIGLNFGGNAINGFHCQQVGAVYAQVTIGGNPINFRFNFGVHLSFPLYIVTLDLLRLFFSAF